MIRKAKIEDIKQIQKLINYFSGKDLMLPRSLSQLYENLRDFWVAEEDKRILGCAALHICWDNLVEIKSLAVERKEQGKGLGKELVNACVDEARRLGAKKVFVLTYTPAFFKRFGFKQLRHTELPHKIWAECIDCPKFPECNEIAMVKQL